MKKIFLTLTIMLVTLSTQAMSYQQAREHALFLTDKMAYELDLTEEQYEAAYEVNLDYLMSVTTADDLYSDYWTRRNLDLSYILFDWQYRTFCGIEYFYRPLHWSDGIWRFRIFAHYPHRTYFYFGRPACYYSYHGGHAWHLNGGRSWYKGHHFTRHDYGMRGGWDRGGYRSIKQGWRHNDGGNRGINHDLRPGRGTNNHPGIGHRGNGNRNFRDNDRQNGTHREFNRGGNFRDDNRNGRGNRRQFNGSRDDQKIDGAATGHNRQNGATINNSGRNNGRTFNRTETTRPSSTRTTVGGHTRSNSSNSYSPSRSFSGNRSQSTVQRSASHSSSRGAMHGSGGASRNSGGNSRGGHFGGGHR